MGGGVQQQPQQQMNENTNVYQNYNQKIGGVNSRQVPPPMPPPPVVMNTEQI